MYAQLVNPLPNFQLNLRKISDASNDCAVVNVRADNFRRQHNLRCLAEVENQIVRENFRQNLFVVNGRGDFYGRINVETIQPD